jgi:hypothetical protein
MNISARSQVVRLALSLVLVVWLAGCSSLPALPTFSEDEGVRVKITSVPLKIVLAAGGAALEVAAEEFVGVRIDSKDLLRQIIVFEDAESGLPAREDTPVIMVINKNTNDVLYWQLSESVQAIRLRHETPGSIELKVANEAPLRVELWISGNVEELAVDVDLRQ